MCQEHMQSFFFFFISSPFTNLTFSHMLLMLSWEFTRRGGSDWRREEEESEVWQVRGRRRRRKDFVDERGRRMDVWAEKSRVCGKYEPKWRSVSWWRRGQSSAPWSWRKSSQPDETGVMWTATVLLLLLPHLLSSAVCTACMSYMVLVCGYQELWEIYHRFPPEILMQSEFGIFRLSCAGFIPYQFVGFHHSMLTVVATRIFLQNFVDPMMKIYFFSFFFSPFILPHLRSKVRGLCPPQQHFGPVSCCWLRRKKFPPSRVLLNVVHIQQHNKLNIFTADCLACRQEKPTCSLLMLKWLVFQFRVLLLSKLTSPNSKNIEITVFKQE